MLQRSNRIRLAKALSTEIEDLANDVVEDEEFDELLSDIDTLIQRYRI